MLWLNELRDSGPTSARAAGQDSPQRLFQGVSSARLP